MPFPVQCSSCRSKFALPDAVFKSRIEGKVLDIPCKHCQSPIRVDGTRGMATAGTEEGMRVESEQSPMVRAQQAALAKRAASRVPSPSEYDLPTVKDAEGDLPAAKSERGKTGATQLGFPSVRPAPTAGPQVVVGRMSLGDGSKLRVPLPGVMARPIAGVGAAAAVNTSTTNLPVAKATASAKPNLESVTLSAADLLEDDDFDLPTGVLARPKAKQGPPAVKPRAASGVSNAFKATMMGVAPPPSPTKLGESNTRVEAVREEAVREDARAIAGSAPGPSAAGTSGSAKLQQGGGPPPNRRARLQQGTIMGLAPAPLTSDSGAFGAVDPDVPRPPPFIDAFDDEATRVEDASVFEEETVAGAGVSKLDVDETLAQPGSDALNDPKSPAGLDLPDLSGEFAEVGTGTRPLASLPQEDFSDATIVEGRGAEAVPAQLEPAGLELSAESEPRAWESSDADVSKQIAQSLPSRAPGPRRRRWMLAAFVSVFGGVAVVTTLIATGHIPIAENARARVTALLSPLSGQQAAAPTVSETAAGASNPNPAAAAPEQLAVPEKLAVPAEAQAQGSAAPGVQAPPSEAKDGEKAAGEQVADSPAEGKADANPPLPVQGATAVSPEPAPPVAAKAPEPSKPASVETAAKRAVEAAALLASGSGAPEEEPKLARAVDEIPNGVREGTVTDRLYRAMQRAKKCHLRGRAVGNAEVTVTFAPNGRVQSSSVKGEPIASAPVADCVRANLEAVLIPAFTGQPFSMVQPITLD